MHSSVPPPSTRWLVDDKGKPMVMRRIDRIEADHGLPLWFTSASIEKADPVHLLLQRPQLYTSMNALQFAARKAQGNLLGELLKKGFDGVRIAPPCHTLLAELDEEEHGLSVALQNAMAQASNACGLHTSDLARIERHIVRIQEALQALERERASLMASAQCHASGQQWMAVAFRNDQVIPAMDFRRFPCTHQKWPKAMSGI